METNEYRAQRLASMQALKDMGFEPYGCKYDHEDLAKVRAEFEEGKAVRIAGRLLMFLTGCNSIRDVVLFPQMKQA